MLADLDKLPHGPDWHVHEIDITVGTQPRTQYLFARNIVDLVCELIGNPRFRKFVRYRPEKNWT
jgi:hypothetical protein